MLICSVSFDFATPWNASHQAPLSTGFPKQEYWSVFSFPAPGDHADPGIEPEFPVFPALAGRVLTTVSPEKHIIRQRSMKIFYKT